MTKLEELKDAMHAAQAAYFAYASANDDTNVPLMRAAYAANAAYRAEKKKSEGGNHD